jgi:hypothetical protein
MLEDMHYEINKKWNYKSLAFIDKEGGRTQTEIKHFKESVFITVFHIKNKPPENVM